MLQIEKINKLADERKAFFNERLHKIMVIFLNISAYMMDRDVEEDACVTMQKLKNFTTDMNEMFDSILSGIEMDAREQVIQNDALEEKVKRLEEKVRQQEEGLLSVMAQRNAAKEKNMNCKCPSCKGGDINSPCK